MAYTSEIEKLERRWAENPKGRNFAPLADAYRKAGELDRAIELCQSGLELHPDYVSAHIVLGRCLVDQKNDAGAEGVFRKVLELDPENILALRMLSELSERNERFDDAVQWLDKLLSADPMNGDAAEAIARVKGKAAQAAARPAPPPPVEVAPAAPSPEAAAPEVPPEEPLQVEHLEIERTALAEQPTTAMGMPDFQLERASAGHPSPEAAAPSAELEVFDGALDFGTVAGSAAATEGLQLEEPEAVPTDLGAPIEGLARTQYEGSGVFKVEQGELPPEPVEPPATMKMAPPPAPLEVDAEFDLEPPANPVADLPLIMPEDVEPLEPAAPPARRTPPPAPRVSIPRASIPAAVQLSDDDGAADTAALSQAEPVLTETMAELYLQQGHRNDALRVYEALLAERPGDPRLQSKVDNLKGRDGGRAEPLPPRQAASGLKVADFLRGILRAKPGSAAPQLTPPANTTLDQVFSQVPEEEPPPGGGEPAMIVPAPGAPTRMASDSISLDSVFGDETGTHPTATLPAPETSTAEAVSPPPSAATAQRAASSPAPSGAKGGGFSFDDFFSSPPAAAESESVAAAPSPLPAGPATKPASAAPASPSSPQRPSGRTSRGGAQEDEQDLDHFQEWLKGLKA